MEKELEELNKALAVDYSDMPDGIVKVQVGTDCFSSDPDQGAFYIEIKNGKKIRDIAKEEFNKMRS